MFFAKNRTKIKEIFLIHKEGLATLLFLHKIVFIHNARLT